MRPVVLALASVLTMSLAACGGSSPIQQQYQPQIINVADSFEFQLTGVLDGDGSLSYAWQNSGSKASVDRSSSISGGTVTLTVRDSAHAVVYQGPLDGTTGSVQTAAGATGTWTIAVDFVHATGTINFRVQKQ